MHATISHPAAPHTAVPHATAPNATAPQPSTPLATGQYAAEASASQAPHVAPVNPDTTRAYSITSFVLGIASVVSGWTFFVPVAGLIFGIISLRRQTTERTLALWGVWLNAAMLALSALFVLAFVFVISLGLFALPFAV